MKTSLLAQASLGLLVALGGCSQVPRYARPDTSLSTAFKEAGTAAAAGVPADWKPVQPSEHQARGTWWAIFADPVLDDLERQALDANQELKAAVARVQEARALNRRARADLFPTVDAGFGPTRQRVSPAANGLPPDAEVAARTLWRAEVRAAYEVDLFGRVAAQTAATGADAEQREAFLRSVHLSLQADVARTYFRIRALDAELALLNETVRLREDALRLMQRRFSEGDISELDLARARTELSQAQSDALSIERERASTEHGMAILLGKAPAQFSLPASPLVSITAQVPPGLPSALLERRHDIAAAEYAVIAANARVGMARSAYFPNLILTGTAGFESASLRDLDLWSSRTFLLGPLVGTALSLPLFDGGRRRSGVENAEAVYQQAVAHYRQQVLVAFREVEDSLSGLHVVEQQERVQAVAVTAARRAADLSRTLYREGQIGFLDVIEAERTVEQAQRTAVRLAGARATSTVDLISALGGSWDAPKQ